MKNKLRILLVISLMFVLLAFLSSSSNGKSCSNINFGKDATVDGSVIVMGAQEGGATPNIEIVPRQTFKKGEMAPVYYNRWQQTSVPPPAPLIKVGEIPQVENTYAYFLSGFPFMNEYQVMISDEYLGYIRPELTTVNGIMDSDQLMIFALQRGKTAREAIKVVGSLIEKYGLSANYGPEAWSVTDPNEAWWFEIMGGGADWTPDSGRPGAVWVAQRVPDDEVSFNFNRSRIGEIDLNNKDYFMASPNVFSLAEEMGWWDSKSGEPFIFWKAYSKNPGRENREWRAVGLLAPSLNPDINQDRWPFSIKPDKGKLSVQEIMEIQRDVFEGTEIDQTKGLLAGPWGSPDRHDNWTTHAFNHQYTTHHFVAQSRNWLPDPIGGLMWFGWDKAATGCETPLYCGATKVPDSWQNQRFDLFDRNSAFWAFNFVANWANLGYSYMIEDIREARHYLMDDMFAIQPAIEAKALELYKKDPALAVRFLTDYSINTANMVENYWWELGDKLVAKYDDGLLLGDRNPDYPDWWLEAVKAVTK